MRDTLSSLASALYSAMYIDMPPITYERVDYSQGAANAPKLPRIKVERRPHESELEVRGMFMQSWGSTALGFGGIGGQAITGAYTVIISCDMTNTFAVYFGGRFAYKIVDPNAQFFMDASNLNMAEVARAGKYLRDKTGQSQEGPSAAPSS